MDLFGSPLPGGLIKVNTQASSPTQITITKGDDNTNLFFSADGVILTNISLTDRDSIVHVKSLNAAIISQEFGKDIAQVSITGLLYRDNCQNKDGDNEHSIYGVTRTFEENRVSNSKEKVTVSLDGWSGDGYLHSMQISTVDVQGYILQATFTIDIIPEQKRI